VVIFFSLDWFYNTFIIKRDGEEEIHIDTKEKGKGT
jgi:hypothetical protein